MQWLINAFVSSHYHEVADMFYLNYTPELKSSHSEFWCGLSKRSYLWRILVQIFAEDSEGDGSEAQVDEVIMTGKRWM